MGLLLNHDLCIGCGACMAACPAEALTLEGGEIFYRAEFCTLCGICVGTCPVGALSIVKENALTEDQPVSEGIWVFCETTGEEVQRVSYELLSKARELAKVRGTKVTAVLAGTGIRDKSWGLIDCGADHVLCCDDAIFSKKWDQPYADLVCSLIEERHPEILLIGATPFGRSLAPRIAARIRTGLTADCTLLSIDPEKGLLEQTRPAFGGNLMATIVTPAHRPQMATVRPGIFPVLEQPGSRGSIEVIFAPESSSPFYQLEKIAAQPTEDISQAKVLVVAGKGIGSKKNLKAAERLAELLGGSVGVTRPLVDLGWYEYSHQVGQTGRTVSPDLLISCGVSGAIQHLAGISGAKTVIAINTDPEAPIFSVADYKVVGDCMEVLREMIACLERGESLV